MSFFDDFLPACGPEYARLGDPDQLNIELSYLRNGTYAFDALTIRLFADAWARWTIEQNQPPEQLARYVSELNLLKTSPDNDLQRTFESSTRKPNATGASATGAGPPRPPTSGKLFGNSWRRNPAKPGGIPPPPIRMTDPDNPPRGAFARFRKPPVPAGSQRLPEDIIHDHAF